MTRAAPGAKLPSASVAFICVIFILGTLMIAGNTKFDEMMWIDDRSFPGGPDAFLQLDYDNAVMNMLTRAISSQIFLRTACW